MSMWMRGSTRIHRLGEQIRGNDNRSYLKATPRWGNEGIYTHGLVRPVERPLEQRTSYRDVTTW